LAKENTMKETNNHSPQLDSRSSTKRQRMLELRQTMRTHFDNIQLMVNVASGKKNLTKKLISQGFKPRTRTLADHYYLQVTIENLLNQIGLLQAELDRLERIE